MQRREYSLLLSEGDTKIEVVTWALKKFILSGWTSSVLYFIYAQAL